MRGGLYLKALDLHFQYVQRRQFPGKVSLAWTQYYLDTVLIVASSRARKESEAMNRYVGKRPTK